MGELPVLEADPLNIGVIWSPEGETLRACFARLASTHPECRFYSLEAQSPAPTGVRELAAHFKSASEQASWLKQLDLVISPSHPVAQAACRLQRPLWLLCDDTTNRADYAPTYPDLHFFQLSEAAGPEAIEAALSSIYGR